MTDLDSPAPPSVPTNLAIPSRPGAWERFRRAFRAEGLGAVWEVLFRRLYLPAAHKVLAPFHRHQLLRILACNDRYSVGPIVLLSSIGWRVRLFQRSQHLALALAGQGCLYFYCVKPSWHQDRLVGFIRVAHRCYVTSRSDLIRQHVHRFTAHVNSTDLSLAPEEIAQLQAEGHGILYEYIDEISPIITGALPTWAHQRHGSLIRDETVACTATADRLMEEVAGARHANFALVTNGVKLLDFRDRESGTIVPSEMARMKSLGKPIIGYYGGIAPWVDFDLIHRIAATRRYTVCLIGPLYHLTLREAGIGGVPAIEWIGAVEYKDLPHYAAHFDICTIPFLVNEITESTSPVKLFEYMALGKPIVTTNMRECRKYKSVVIGQNHDDFLAKLDGALRGDYDESHYRFLGKEAEDNSWAAKAQQIVALMEGQEPKAGDKPSRETLALDAE